MASDVQFVNETDAPVTIPDGFEGALIVPAGHQAVPGPDHGRLIAVRIPAEHADPEPEPEPEHRPRRAKAKADDDKDADGDSA